jgi:hypothetical protein
MATGRREVAFAEATNGRSQHIFRKLEFAEPAQILDRSLRSEAVVGNPKYAGKRGLSEAIPNRVVDEWEIAKSLIEPRFEFGKSGECGGRDGQVAD